MNSSTVPRQVGQALQELKLALDDIYGNRLQGVYLYGSYARHEATGHSDIDVMIVLDGPVKTGLEISRINPLVSSICLQNDLLISTFPVSADSFQNDQSPFLLNVRKEAVPL